MSKGDTTAAAHWQL